MPYVANARMYAVNPAAESAWRDLFRWLAQESQVDLRMIDHGFPAPLSDLWSRPDLGCAFMCGFPYRLSTQPPRPIAAPVPLQAPPAGQPVYATRLVVRATSSYRTLEDTFGGRLGYTVADSHSGYNALRHHLLPYWLQNRASLYRESKGPLVTPRRVIDALLTDEIDVGPLDSFALDLMMRHEPDLAQHIRIVATTDAAPIPFLVASRDCPDAVADALRSTLLTFGNDPACADLQDRLCLQGFAPVATGDYDQLLQWDAEARAAGYPRPV